MEIDLYTISDFNNTVDRAIGDPVKITGTIKEESFSILQPVFLLKNPSGGRIFKYNYLYSPDFNRYYFITDYNIMNNGTIQVNCKVDVLKTYAATIKNSSGIVTFGAYKGRNATNPLFKNTNYINKDYTTLVKKAIVRKEIGIDTSVSDISNILTDGTFILLANRGD